MTAPGSNDHGLSIDMVGARQLPASHGGLEVAAEELSVELVSRGHTVRALVDSRTTDRASYRGVRITGIPCVHTKHLHALTQSFLSVPKVRAGKASVVHLHGVGPGMAGRFARGSNRVTVTTVQGLDWDRPKWGAVASKAFESSALAGLRHSDAVISVDRGIQQTLRSTFDIDSVYIPNGVRDAVRNDETSFISELGLTPRRYLLFASRLVPEKGAHHLIAAFRRIARDETLVIAGTGSSSYMSEYENSIKQAAGPNVIFVGHQSGSNLSQLFSHARLYILPSSMEGLSLSLLEAMSYGLPVIHSDIPECAEVTRDGAGFSFPLHDERMLAQLIDDLLDDEDLCSEAGAAAQKRVASEYSWPHIAKDIEALYFEILLRKGTSRSL